MFNLPLKIIVFDTEYTTWEGAQERDWSGPNEYKEVVQIGAVKVETDDFQELDSFSVYVKPKINPKLSDFFTRLTGITQGTLVKEGVDFQTAIQRFAEWSSDLPLYSWTRGDMEVLEENCALVGIPFPFAENCFSDARSIFKAHGIPIENYMSSTIIEAFGKRPSRRGHDALNDARTIIDALRELRK